MTTLTVNIDNEKDLPVLKEILTRFGLNYYIDKNTIPAKDKLYSKLQRSFKEIKDWEAGNGALQNAKAAILEIEKELDNNIKSSLRGTKQSPR